MLATQTVCSSLLSSVQEPSFPLKICFLWCQGYYKVITRSGVGCILRVSSTVQGGIGMCTQGFPNRDGRHRDVHLYFLGHVSLFLSQMQNIFFLILHYFSITATLDVSDWKAVQKTRSPHPTFRSVLASVTLLVLAQRTILSSHAFALIDAKCSDDCMNLWLHTYALLLECLPELFTQLTFLWFFLFFWPSLSARSRF